QVSVLAIAFDPISQAGITAQLRDRPEIRLVEDARAETPGVVVVVTDEVDGQAERAIRSSVRGGESRVVVVATRLDNGNLLGPSRPAPAACSGGPRLNRTDW